MRALSAWPNLKVLTIDHKHKQPGKFRENKAEKTAYVPIISGRKNPADQISFIFSYCR